MSMKKLSVFGDLRYAQRKKICTGGETKIIKIKTKDSYRYFLSDLQTKVTVLINPRL